MTGSTSVNAAGSGDCRRTSMPQSEPRAGRKKRKDRDVSLDRTFLKVNLNPLRPSKSTSNLAQKAARVEAAGVELSTEGSVPGVLKIFGDSVVAGANYKSVLASTGTLANDLVQEALERYGLHDDQACNYVICDVVGRLSGDADTMNPDHWTEECVRIVAAYERPLTLQQYWKPSEGFARRFELRRRSDFPCSSDSPSLTPPLNFSPDINDGPSPQSRSPSVLTNSDQMSLLSGTESDVTLPGDYDSSSLSQVEADQAALLNRYGGVQDLTLLTTPRDSSSHFRNSISSASTPMHSSNTNSPNTSQAHVRLPQLCPYLVVLRGADPARDAIAYTLTTDTVTLGSDTHLLQGTDISLHAADILPAHCCLQRQANLGLSAHPGPYTIEPRPGASLRINGAEVTTQKALAPGDVLALGTHYLLLFKDYCALESSDRFSPSSQLMSQLQQDRRHSWKHTPTAAASPFQRRPTMFTSGRPPGVVRLEEPLEVLEWRRQRNLEYESGVPRLRLSYSPEKEDALLDAILGVEREGLYALTPAYLLLMTLEHCAVKYEQVATRQLVVKLAKLINKKITSISQTVEDKAPDRVDCPLETLMQDMHPVFMWLSNILEMHHYIRSNMNHFLLAPSCCALPASRSSLASAEDEIISGLEEAVIYTFQHIVYYLTKVLYASLPAVLESNPFSGTDDGIDSVLSLYQSILALANSCILHPQIISQLFCYLFFFTSTSLFNLLMAKDASKKYFKWSRGAQLRGNLDSIEAWAAGNDLRQEASAYLRKINCLADLLATPKVQLLQADWRCLRPDFPALTPAQLHHVLAGYQLEAGVVRPSTWLPTPEDVLLLERAGPILETYNQHPPLILPTSGYKLDLHSELKDKSFHDALNEIVSAHGDMEDDDDDSGLSISHHPSSSQDQDLTQDSCSPFPCPDSPTPEPRSPEPPRTRTHRKAPLVKDDRCSEGEEYAIDVPSELGQCDAQSKSPEFCDISKLKLDSSEVPVPPARKSRTRKKVDSSSSVPDSEGKFSMLDRLSGMITSTPRRSRSSSPGTSTLHTKKQYIEDGIHYDMPNQNDHVYMNYPLSRGKSSDGTTKAATDPDYAVPMYNDRLPLQVVKATYGRKKLGRHFSDNYRSSPVSMLARSSRSLDEGQDSFRSPHTKDVMIIPLVMQDSTDTDPGRSMLAEGEAALLMDENVFEVHLTKSDRGLGLGLIDGMYTPLRKPGIYVRTLVDGEAAATDGKLSLGDRILAVNGTSVVGADYQRAMNLIREGGQTVVFLVSQTNMATAMQITASTC